MCVGKNTFCRTSAAYGDAQGDSREIILNSAEFRIISRTHLIGIESPAGLSSQSGQPGPPKKSRLVYHC